MTPVLYPDELQSPSLVLEFLEFTPHRFLREPAYFFAMVDPPTRARMGAINLRVSHAFVVEQYAGHIGYAVLEPFRGRRLAAQAVAMLRPLALRNGINPLWITCDPDNAASRRTAEIAGARLVETVDVPPESPYWQGGARRKCRYRLEL